MLLRHEFLQVLPDVLVYQYSRRSRRGLGLQPQWNIICSRATHSLTYSLALRQYYQQKRKVR